MAGSVTIPNLPNTRYRVQISIDSTSPDQTFLTGSTFTAPGDGQWVIDSPTRWGPAPCTLLNHTSRYTRRRAMGRRRRHQDGPGIAGSVLF